MSKLTNKQQEFFAYTGTFGALLAATCLFQHLAIARDHWIAHSLTFIYIYSILDFIFLALKKTFAPVLLIISTILVLLAELILLTNFVFSLVVLLLFVYSTVIVVLLYIEQLPRKLKEQALAERMEADVWKDRI